MPSLYDCCVRTNLNFCPTEGAAATPALRVLPGSETGSAEQVAARLYPDVFRVLRADLAQLEGGAHLTVELVLLLCHLHVVLRSCLKGKKLFTNFAFKT